MLQAKRTLLPLALCALPLFVTACRQDMHDNPRYKVYKDGGNRQVPAGTVARGALATNLSYPSTLKVAEMTVGSLAAPAPSTGAAPVPKGDDGFPFALTQEVLDRGQERYQIHCTPCHGVVGDGKGMIGMRGFKKPPSYHDERLRQAPASYFYDVITHGFGAMSNYAQEITPEDRWKVAAYIRVLQFSQRADFNSLPDADKARLNAIEVPKPVATPTASGTPAATATVIPATPLAATTTSGTAQTAAPATRPALTDTQRTAQPAPAARRTTPPATVNNE